MPTLQQIFSDLFYFQRAELPPSLKHNWTVTLQENDSFILKVIWCYWFTSIFISFYFATYLLGFIGGGLLTATALLSHKMLLGLPRQIVFCLCLCLFGGLFVLQQPGYVEPHFAFYASVYLLTRYKDVRPLLIFIVFTVIYYLLFSWLQSQGTVLFGIKVQLYTWGLWDAFAFHMVAFITANIVFALIIRNHIVDFKTSQRLQVQLNETKTGLNQRVIERTAELARKTDNLKNMLDNLSVGLLLINPDKTVHRQYSSYLEGILSTNKIAAEPVMTLLFANSDATKTQIEQTTSILNMALGKDAMKFYLNKHLLITQCNRRSLSLAGGKGEKTLTFNWQPVLNQAGQTEQLLVTIEDITRMKALQHEVSHKDRQLQIIAQIQAVPSEQFHQFISQAKSAIDENRQLLDTTPEKDVTVINTLFSNIHTIKCTARNHGLLPITNQLHDCENEYDLLRRHAGKLWFPQTLRPHLTQCLDIIEEYETINSKLGRAKSNLADDHWLIREKSAAALLEKLEPNEQLEPSKQLEPGKQLELDEKIDEVETFFTLLGSQSLTVLLAPTIHSMTSLARDLDKPVANFFIHPNDILICASVVNKLQSVFSHIITNALDHGIESGWERAQKNKPQTGQISCRLKLSDNGLVISVEDDGRGLNLDAIRQQAIAAGEIKQDTILSSLQIANLIFAPGISTADKVSLHSGRGFGMDSMQKLLAGHGGRASLALSGNNANSNVNDNINDNGFIPFITNIYLPVQLAGRRHSDRHSQQESSE